MSNSTKESARGNSLQNYQVIQYGKMLFALNFQFPAKAQRRKGIMDAIDFRHQYPVPVALNAGLFSCCDIGIENVFGYADCKLAKTYPPPLDDQYTQIACSDYMGIFLNSFR